MTDQARICPTCGKLLNSGQTSAGTRAGDHSPRATHAEGRADTLAREVVAHVETIANRDRTIQELHGQVAALQSELRETKQLLSAARLEANNARPGARRPGTQVSTTKGLAYRDPTRMLLKHVMLYLGVAALCIAGTAGLVHWISPDNPSGRTAGAPYAAPYKPAMLRETIDASLNIPFVIDDMEVTLSNPRIGPVMQMTMLGKEIASEEHFLKIDVTLSNRHAVAETVAHQPWQGALIRDDGNRKYRTIQDQPYDVVQEIRGRIVSQNIKPGETVTDMMVFPWKETTAGTFTLTADPDFRRLADDERMVQISLSSFRIAFGRADIARP